MLINHGLTENDNENTQFGSLKSYEPQILDKKQEVALKNTTSLQIGDAKLATYEPFLSNLETKLSKSSHRTLYASFISLRSILIFSSNKANVFFIYFVISSK